MSSESKTPELFVWSECYLTGDSQIDEEHHRLVQLINRVGTLQGESATPAEVSQTLDELVAYSIEHFSNEEGLMKRACDPRYVSAHIALHQNFIRQIEQMRRAGARIPGTDNLVKFLSSWLAYHILGIDRSAVRQIAKVRAGMTPLQAYQEEKNYVSDPATHSLLNAMHGLYAAISLRNQQLLELANSLELRVADRTTELATVNTSLQMRNEELQAMNSQLSQMREKLLHAEKMASVGQLAAGVAHEINNPIGFVKSNINRMSDYLERLMAVVHEAGLRPRTLDLDALDEDVPLLIIESQQGIRRVQKIIEDLQSFAQADDSQAMSWSNPNAIIDGVLRGRETLLNGHASIRRIGGPLPDVYCVASNIHDVVDAMVVNAIESISSREMGSVWIRSGSNGSSVWIDVADSGRGIQPEILKRIFDPFFTTKKVGAGTGMGLSRAYGFVENHKGKIDVRSKPGKGSVFRIWLPIGSES